MSRLTKIDYYAIWQELKQKVFVGNFSLQKAVMDFEMAAWISLRANFPGKKIHGCLFHYSQAIYRRVVGQHASRQHAQKECHRQEAGCPRQAVGGLR